MRASRTAVVATAVVALVGAPTAASANDDGHGNDSGGVTTVADGLDGPRQLDDFRNDQFVVAESDSREVSAVDRKTGTSEALLTIEGIPQGVEYDDGLLHVAVGEAEPGTEDLGSALLVAKPDGTILETIDLLAYELENNPDEQPQFGEDGAPFDALSNPFAVESDGNRILVADAGANAVLAIDRKGDVSTFFVPPRVSPEDVPACAEAQANPGVVGCDPVPTGVEKGPDGRIYVSTLGAEVPGASRVFVLSSEGTVVDVIEGLTGSTGIAVADDGTVYVSELLEGAPPELPPPPGFDPATVGQIVRIAPDGTRSAAQVTMPTGLEIEDGALYASAWSVASFIGLEGAGEIVRVGDDAFAAAAE